MAFELNTTRTPMPQRADGDARDETGGQWEWCWAVPLPYRVLAAPLSGLPMPELPGTTDPLEAVGYWACLQSFLTYSFGWTRHDRGLAWWLDAGRPTDDPRFKLIDQVWGADGAILRYLEWLVAKSPFTGPIGAMAHEFDGRPLDISPAVAHAIEFARNQSVDGHEDSASPHGKHLELGSHIEGPSAEFPEGVDRPGRLMVESLTSSRAVWVTDVVPGWYGALARHAKSLPASEKSWRVDVFVTPIGYVGEYRRSWKTGLWFAGPHRYHSVGN